MPKARLTSAVLSSAAQFKGLVADGDGSGAMLSPEANWNSDDVVTGLSKPDIRQLEALYVGSNKAFEQLRPYRSEVMKDNPLGYWYMDSLTVQNDQSGRSPLVPTTAALPAGAVVATPLAEGGSNAYQAPAASYTVSWGDNFGFSGLASHSIELWYQPSQVGTSAAILAKTDSGAITGWFLSQSSTGVISYTRRGSGTSANCNSVTSMSAGTWYHIAVAYDGPTNTAKMFVNGILERNTLFSSLPTGIDATTNPMRLGSSNNSAATSPNLNSLFAEVAVYDSAVADDRFHAHWAGGKYGFS